MGWAETSGVMIRIPVWTDSIPSSRCPERNRPVPYRTARPDFETVNRSAAGEVGACNFSSVGTSFRARSSFFIAGSIRPALKSLAAMLVSVPTRSRRALKPGSGFAIRAFRDGHGLCVVLRRPGRIGDASSTSPWTSWLRRGRSGSRRFRSQVRRPVRPGRRRPGMFDGVLVLPPTAAPWPSIAVASA